MVYRYQKVKVSCKDCPERFYRVFSVREDLNLQQIGALIIAYFQGAFEHMWQWRSNSHRYIDKTWLEDFHRKGDVDYELFKLSTSELNAASEINYEYDTGDGWEFTVKVFPEVEERDFTTATPRKDSVPWGILSEGRGECLWEDNRSLFNLFLEKGKLSKTYGVPWYGNPKTFDDPLDIDKLDKTANAEAKKVIKQLKRANI